MPCSTGCRVCSARAPARSRKGATRAKENSARAKAIWKTSRPPAVSDFTIAELTVKPRLAAIIQRAPRWLGESFSQPPEILERTAVIQGWSFTDSAETCSVARSRATRDSRRSEEHTSELQSLMRLSYAVFCLKKTNK